MTGQKGFETDVS